MIASCKQEVARSRRPIRSVLWLGMVLATMAIVMPAMAQKVAPRLTGAMVLAHLGKVQHALQSRAGRSPNPRLRKVADQLQHMSEELAGMLGHATDQPLTTIDEDARAQALRADAGARRAAAWLKVAKTACGPGELDAMLAALSTTLDRLARDDASQDAPLPIIHGVQTLDQHPLFALQAGAHSVPKFVLTGANLVDPACASPTVVAVDAQGKPAPAQPQLVAAQPARIELQWPGVGRLTPGSYVIEVTAERKRFLLGCGAEPKAVAAIQVMAPSTFAVGYAIKATCAGSTTPTTLDAGTLSMSAGSARGAAKTIDTSSCPQPGSYTITGSIRTPSGSLVSTYGPITHGAGVTVTQGLGHGLTLHWNPFLHQLLVTTGNHTCKGVY